jgi:hypothetical protein
MSSNHPTGTSNAFFHCCPAESAVKKVVLSCAVAAVSQILPSLPAKMDVMSVEDWADLHRVVLVSAGFAKATLHTIATVAMENAEGTKERKRLTDVPRG